MSDVIKLLPDHISNQIAAGEVIQRPASVVKELVENAIDAKADVIKVVIKDAGRTLIQVLDNGVGMSKNDAIKCFERHATSKVSNVNDLYNLSTKGFRGEALASIASIAHVTLQTKTKEAELGVKIVFEGSTIISNDLCTCSDGSNFEVKNLFYNVPARRNFLKSDSVEFNHILDEFERVVLAHPELSFILIHNNQEIFNLSKTILKKRIVDVLGRNAMDKLIPVDELTDIVKISGFIGKPELAKKSRGEQFFFVNGRFFKDTYFNHAVGKGFEGILPPKMFPSYFIYFELDPSKIDVNVHPTKTEIKFEEDRSIYAILMSAVRQSLGKFSIAPTLDFERETSFDVPLDFKNSTPIAPTINVNPDYNPFKPSTFTKSTNNSVVSSNSSAIKSQGFGNRDIQPQEWESFYKIKEKEAGDLIEQTTLHLDAAEKKTYLFKSGYLFTLVKSGMMVVNIRRAKERIVYDHIMKQFVSEALHTQQLLFPIEKQLSTAERKIWSSSQSMLTRMGFIAELKNDTLEISGIPNWLNEENGMDCMEHIFSEMHQRDIDKGEIAHYVAQAIARSHATSFSNRFNSDEAPYLIEQLFQCPEHIFTPKGKKIIDTIDINRLTETF
jgi:DNA mismatch repair protein MutL